MELLINQVLGDRYQIQSLLGRQTGRRTFLAQDLQTEQSVVLKLLLFGPDFTWDDLKLFEREAEVLKSIDLPTIPKYLDCFDIDTELGKGFVLVQTYIHAKSLQNYLDSGRNFSEEDLISIATQLLAILDYLHNRQPAIIHRDIKPSNILLGDRSGNSPGQIYLVDFGSVRTATNGSTITVVGTYGYMPPEQFGGQTIPASDLYSLGATIICLATGQHPSELPHRDMRIDFADQVNLSLDLIDWIKLMIATSVDSRLRSASQSLLALTEPNSRDKTLTNRPQPFGSKIQVKKTSRTLDVVVPARGFHIGLIGKILFAIIWNCLALPIFTAAIALNGVWFTILFASVFVVSGLYMIWSILFTLTGTRKLSIDESQISLFLSIFGWRYFSFANAFRQHITTVELAPLWYEGNSKGYETPVAPQLNIWAGTTQFCLTNNFALTKPEQEWLAGEIADWLDLQVTRV
jgi:serine/threonine protein kinase